MLIFAWSIVVKTDNSFHRYCEQCTDAQLLAVIDKEREGCERDFDRGVYFSIALDVANKRGLGWS